MRTNIYVFVYAVIILHKAISTQHRHHPIIPKAGKRRWPPHGRLSRRWLMSFLCYSSHRPSTTVLEGSDRGIILFRDSSSRRRSVTADNFARDGAFDGI